MSTCKYCGRWVAGLANECNSCKNKAIKDPRFRNKQFYNMVRKIKIS